MRFDLCQVSMRAAIQASVSLSHPVRLTLMAFPFKVGNPVKVGVRQLPDSAELAALLKLRQLRDEITAIYEPGLEIHLIHDGSYIADVFGVPLREVRQYESYLSRLIHVLGANTFIRTHDLLDLLEQNHYDLECAKQIAWRVTRGWWRDQQCTPEWNDCFAKTIGMLNLRSWPAGLMREIMSQAHTGRLAPTHHLLERRVHRAMLAYHMRDTLLHMFDPRPSCFPNSIHATTKVRPQRLALWMVRRGNSLLPWHGVGVLEPSGINVRPAAEVIDNPAFCPLYLEAENTPFLYLQVGVERKPSSSYPHAAFQEHSVC
ncbi:MAG TPA: L-tyrosine/L-tryptophan isonitrile synthase family protein [Terriglobales bacterium]|nr:L-tyrosine/L-tryptophan isonitrile synthase family protein [Terriglobales bacterium]